MLSHLLIHLLIKEGVQNSITKGKVLKLLDQHEKAIKQAVETGDRQTEAAELIEYGKLISLAQLGDANKYFQKARLIAQGIDNRILEISVLCIYGQTYTNRLDITAANSYYQEALLLARGIGDAEVEEYVAQQITKLDYMLKFDKLTKE
jgi:hypothetical protein